MPKDKPKGAEGQEDGKAVAAHLQRTRLSHDRVHYPCNDYTIPLLLQGRIARDAHATCQNDDKCSRVEADERPVLVTFESGT
jgi:hypothetical protein